MPAWPVIVHDRFNHVPTGARENEYYGPYNKLLHCLFPFDSPFTVAPQSYPVPNSRNSVDFVVEYAVFYGDVPVLILEIKSADGLNLGSARQEADSQIRDRLFDLTAQCPLSVLHAVSAFGTKLCFYTGTNGAEGSVIVTPVRIPADPVIMLDTAPATRWDSDVMEDGGANRLKAIVAQIQAECASLCQSLLSIFIDN